MKIDRAAANRNRLSKGRQRRRRLWIDRDGESETTSTNDEMTTKEADDSAGDNGISQGSRQSAAMALGVGPLFSILFRVSTFNFQSVILIPTFSKKRFNKANWLYVQIRKRDWTEQGPLLKARINAKLFVYQSVARLKIKSLASLDTDGKTSKRLVLETLALLVDAAESCLLC